MTTVKGFGSLTVDAVHCLDNVYVGKQPVAWKECCAVYWSKELDESMDRCADRRDLTEILLKAALNTIQSIKLPKRWKILLEKERKNTLGH